MKASGHFILCLSCLIAPLALAETVKDREAAVRQDKAALETDARWAYNDMKSGFARAKKTGKPLMAVLRCVPCLACAGIDASVLTEPSLAPLLDNFVCVRLINANALDLSLFQFDYDLSFSVLFFNADGTLYGRFGSWTHQKNQHEKSTASLSRAMEGALEIHHAYPENKPMLLGKQGTPSPYQTPVNIPTLDGKYRLELDWKGKVVPSCVHCHQIADALRIVHRNKNEAIPAELIYPMPAPETIGLVMAPEAAATVESVRKDSIGARAGFESGDRIVTLSGQYLLSVADVSWALHRAPEVGSLVAVIKRGSAEMGLAIELPAGWRSKSDIARRVGTWGMRGMATGGLLLEDLADGERRQQQIGTDRMALLVKHVGEYGSHAAAKKSGFLKGDVVVDIAGISGRMTESELIGYLLQKHRPGEKIKASVLRGQQRLDLTLPMQ